MTPQRRYFADRWLWLGGFAALAIASPYLYWQAAHGWPTIQFLVDMNRDVMSSISRPVFVVGQIFYLHPLNAPIWLAGLWYYLGAESGRPYRALGWVYVFVFFFLLAVKSKIYYLAPAYPMLLAGGACAIEAFLRERRTVRIKAAVPAALAVGGLVTAPIGLPILPIEKLDAYANAITGGLLAGAYEVTGTFHDQFGWENQVATVAKVFHSLPPEERAACILFAANFGQAGAIDFYGPKYGLPKAYSLHQSYFFWGPPETDPPVMVVIGVGEEDLQRFFDDVEAKAAATCDVAIEKRRNVYVCRKPRGSLRAAWPLFRDRAFRNR